MIDTTLIGVLAAAAVAFVLVLLFLRRRTPPTITPGIEDPPEAAPPGDDRAATDEADAQSDTAEAIPARPVDAGTAHEHEPQAEATDAGTAEAVVAAQAQPVSDLTDESIGAFKRGLQSTRSGFITRIAKLFKSKAKVDDAMVEEIEEILITADIGVRTSERLLARIRSQMETEPLEGDEAVWKLLRAEALDILAIEAEPSHLEHKPSLILVTGVNGVGKTTTIGKLASKYSSEGRRVLLAAGDTYRAAAVLQLEVWGQRVGCPVIKGKEGADPGSVIFDAITRAREERYDLVIADTAGRLHTKQPLMEELKKVERTITKALGGRQPDEILLVLDATTGQNAVQQTHMFREALGITGLVLTKLDGTAKGGVILGIVDEHKVPVRFVGLGERVEDLREFDPKSFVTALFERPSGETLAA